jgi:glycosyltransferase involved in cell wall biosynthesis
MISKHQNKKVVMVVLNEFNNDPRVLREAKTLIEVGYKVFVIALHDKGLKEKETLDGIEVIRIPLKTRKLPTIRIVQVIKYIEFVLKSLYRFSKIRPRICHCHDLNTLPVGYLSKKILNTILIYDSGELESQRLSQESNWYKWINRRMEHFLINRADKVITVSEGIADYLMKQDGISRPVVIRNFPEPSKKINKLPQKDYFGFGKNYKIVIYQGGLTPGRGLISLVKAMKFLNRKIILFLFGDGPLVKELKKEIRQLNLENKVILKGWVEPNLLQELIPQADLGVVPFENISLNHYLALPNKLFEYVAAGLPMAVSDFPEMGGLVKRYKIGFTFDPDKPKDIAKAINNILLTKNYNSFKKNVLKAKKLLTWEKEKQKLINLYKDFNKK